MEDIFKKDLSGEMVSPEEPGYEKLISAIFDTMKLAYELKTVIIHRMKCAVISPHHGAGD